MKILALEVENIKRLSMVRIQPNGNMVQITGKNAQGKSSILDSISWAFEGQSKVQSNPIRNGEERATIRLDLGEKELTEVTVTREFRRNKDGSTRPSTVKVESANGARFGTPETMLKGFLGAFTFDPLEFTRLPPEKQFNALRQFVPDVDFDAIAKANKTDFDKRTDINRRAKEARAAAGQITVPMGLPKELVDEAALVERLEQAGATNTLIETRKSNRQFAVEKAQRLRRQSDDAAAGKPARLAAIEGRRTATVRDIEQQITTLQARLTRVNAEADTEVTDLHDAVADECKKLADEIAAITLKLENAEPLPDPVDTAAVRQQIEAARKTNAGIAARQQKNTHDKRADALEDDAKALTEAMDKRKQGVRDAIAAAKMPVPGIEFGEGVVLLNGVPFDQASSAEQLRTSIAIAMASNPKLRVIRVRDGSLLDEDGLATLATMADEANCQVWVERVASDGLIGFVIQDGEVVSRPAVKDEQPSLLGAAE